VQTSIKVDLEHVVGSCEALELHLSSILELELAAALDQRRRSIL